MCAPLAGATSRLEAARPTARTPAASVAFVSVSDQPTNSSSALPAVSHTRPSSTSAPSAMHASLVSSAATSAAFLEDGLDPVDHAPTATRWSPSATFSPSSALLRLQQGGDHPNPQPTIDKRHCFTRHRWHPSRSASPKPAYASRRTDCSFSTVPAVRIRRNAQLRSPLLFQKRGVICTREPATNVSVSRC